MDNFRLSERGEKFIQEFMGRVKETNIFRMHNLSVTLYLSEIPKDLEQNKAFCPFSNKRYNALKTEILGSKFFYYGSNEAIAYIPEIFGDNKEDLLCKFNSFIHQLINVLEKEFKIKIGGFECYKLNTGHISLLGELKSVKGYYKSSGRFAVDCSHNKPEVETENVETMFQDIEKLQNFKGGINSCRNNIKGGENNG